MKKKEILISILLTILISAIMFFLLPTTKKNAVPKDVYEVFVEGKSIGYLSNENEFLELVDEKQQEIKNNYGVDKVYPPGGLEIEKVTTYNENIKSSEEIYNTIENSSSFTIEGYIITIKYKDGTKEPLYIYTLKKEYFEDAFYNMVSAFVGKDKLNNYKNNTQEEITDEGTKITSVYWEDEITIKKTLISTDKKIFTNTDDLSKYLLFGTTEKQKTYTVKENDSIDNIIENNNLSIEEFLIANPTITSKNTLLKKNQEVSIGLISPLLEIIHEVEVVENITNKAVTEYQEDNDMYVGQTKVIQEGVNGISKVTESIQYKNGEIEKLVITKSEEIKPTVNKIVAKGTKYYSNPGINYEYIPKGNDEWRWPTLSPYVITSPFAWRWGRHHNGIDISGTGFGSPIYAATEGIVTTTYTSCPNQGYLGSMCGNSWGNYVRVSYGEFEIIYAHLKSDIKVSPGQTITRSQHIANMGNSGSSTGTHLHFAILKNGSYINPCAVFSC